MQAWLSAARRAIATAPATAAVLAACVLVLAADVVVVLGRPVPAPVASSPAPPPPGEQSQRRRSAQRVARFAADLSCPDRTDVSVHVLSHSPDWSRVRVRVHSGRATPLEGTVEVEVEPHPYEVRYRVLAATGACVAN